MLSSPLNVRFEKPLRNVRLGDQRASNVSEAQFREGLEERYRAGYEAGQKDLAEQLVQQRKQLIDIQTGLFRNIQEALPNLIAEC